MFFSYVSLWDLVDLQGKTTLKLDNGGTENIIFKVPV